MLAVHDAAPSLRIYTPSCRSARKVLLLTWAVTLTELVASTRMPPLEKVQFWMMTLTSWNVMTLRPTLAPLRISY